MFVWGRLHHPPTSSSQDELGGEVGFGGLKVSGVGVWGLGVKGLGMKEWTLAVIAVSIFFSMPSFPTNERQVNPKSY